MGEGNSNSDAAAIQIEFLVGLSVPPYRLKMQFTANDTLTTARTVVASRLGKDPKRLHFLVDSSDATPIANFLGIAISVVDCEVVTVRHDPGDGRRPYAIHIAVERDGAKTPFLGGYSHRQTGAVYHNATAQTDDLERLAFRAMIDPKQRHRETQTVSIASRTVQTKREIGVQAPRPGLVLDSSGDREVSVRGYVDSEVVYAHKLEKIIQIQCFVRHRFACRRALALLKLRMALSSQTLEANQRLKAAADAERALRIQHRLHPATRADFDALLSELESWRERERQRIVASNDADRQRLLRDLLDKEVRLLQTLDRLQSSAAKTARHMTARLRLNDMAAPKPWTLSTGEVVLVEDPKSVRARHLHELYTALLLRRVTVDERLDLLMQVKRTVSQHKPAPLTKDMGELIDREADMLNRGRAAPSLSGLRHRLANLFYRFACEPEYNPQAGCS